MDWMSGKVSLRDIGRTISIAPVQLSASHIRSPADRAVQPRRPVKKNAKVSGSGIRTRNEQPQSEGLRVLFIEDDDRVLYSVGRLLESKGFRVERAADGQVGLLRARAGQNDVILLDLLLPKRSGIDILRQLRLEGIWTPVVILTGRGGVDTALEAGRLGVAAYFPKPAVLNELTAALRTAAETARAGRSGSRSLFAPIADKSSVSIVTLCLNLEARPGIERNQLARLLADTACARELTFLEFIAVAKSLQFLFSKSNLIPSDAIPTIRDWVENASRRSSSRAELHFEHVLSLIVAAGKGWSSVSEKGIAADLRIDSINLWQTLRKEFGVTLVRCRRAVLMRQAAMELLHGNEHVRQIAFRLGYTDAANFDHDFRSFFGVTPTAFRRA